VLGCLVGSLVLQLLRLFARPPPVIMQSPPARLTDSNEASTLNRPLSHLLLHTPFLSVNLSRLRVCCWLPINTSTDGEISVIRKSWGRECDELLFFSKQGDAARHVFAHGYEMEDQLDLWNIVHRVWAIVYLQVFPACDYYVKIDTDAYFSGFNFKLLVGTSARDCRRCTHKACCTQANLSSDASHYIGHVTWHKAPDLFVLGATIAISRGALRRLGPHLPTVPSTPPNNTKTIKCVAKNSWAEDWQFYKCLRVAGVHRPTLTFDKRGREHFFIYRVSSTLRSSDDGAWLWAGKPRFIGRGTNFSSNRPVTFHTIKFRDDREYYFAYLNYLMFFSAVDPLPSSSSSSSYVGTAVNAAYLGHAS